MYSQKPNTYPELKFEHIGAAQGFYETTVFCNIVQDKTGYIWTGAANGLYRYDGYEFRRFPNEQTENISLLKTGVSCLYADTVNNVLWIGTSGLCFYDPVKETFSVFKPTDTKYSYLSQSSIISMAPDHENNLWIYAAGYIVTLNLATHTINFITHLNGQASIFVDRSGNAWIGTHGSGLHYIDNRTKKITEYHHNPDDKFSICVDNIFNVKEDRSGNIWCATNNGICRFDTATKKFVTFNQEKDNPQSLSYFFVYGGMFVDRLGTLWAGTWGGGLNRFIPETQSFVSYKSEEGNLYSLGCNNVSGIFEDNSGMLWLATDGGGLFKSYLGKENFSLYQNFEENLKTKYITMLYTDAKGIIWIGTYGGGFYTFDPLSKKIHSWLKETSTAFEKKLFDIPLGFFDAGKNMYISSVYEGILQLNHATRKSAVLHSNFLIPGKVKDYNNYATLVGDSLGRLWIGSQHGIMIYDTKSGQLKAFKELFRDTNQLSSDNVWVQNIDGFIWCLGTESGLTRIDPSTGDVKVYKHREGDVTSISTNEQLQIVKDNNNLLWIATGNGGLNVFDPRKEIFRAFTINDGMLQNHIDGLLVDGNNNIWTITPKGISKCSYPPGESPLTAKLLVRNYDFGEDAGNNSHGTVCCTKGKDGTFYFASQNGMLVFHPDSLKDNPFIPPVVITDLLLFNKKVFVNDSSEFLRSSITFTKEIVLNYQQNVIGFRFAALSNNHPEKNQYAYMLSGFDKDWIYTDASERFANYTNLDAGQYVFKVKASNNDGVWNEKPTVLKLVITPPFWETWWFRILGVLSIAMAVYSIYHYRLQQVIKLQVIRNNIASDLHDDIGSTLNSISVFSEVAKKQAEKNIPALDEIGKSSRKIIDAMSDIVWTINPENDNFEKIIVRMRSFAYNLLKAKRIEMVFKADASLNTLTLPMLVRKNFYLIFKEATNNIVKYSKATKAFYHLSYSNKQIHLEIHDNGTGFIITQAKQGNGLKNMKRRAQEINAKIKIESTEGNGTNIELILKT